MLVALLAAACQSTTQKVPDGRIDTRVHTEYAEFRPVTIAVLPVKAPQTDLRTGVRQEIYRMLPERRYSPFRLDEVDARVNADGRFEGGSLDWDATLSIDISSWRAVRGTNYFAGTGKAELRHKTGEVLWTCAFYDYAFDVPSRAGMLDQAVAAKEIAHLFVGGDKQPARLPDCPPPARE